jgi:hypothetical protein
MVFGPGGRSAVSVSGDTVHWWDTEVWQLHRTIDLPKLRGGVSANPSFVTDGVLGVGLLDGSGGTGAFQLIILRNVPEIFREFGNYGNYYEFRMNNAIKVSMRTSFAAFALFRRPTMLRIFCLTGPASDKSDSAFRLPPESLP